MNAHTRAELHGSHLGGNFNSRLGAAVPAPARALPQAKRAPRVNREPHACQKAWWLEACLEGAHSGTRLGAVAPRRGAVCSAALAPRTTRQHIPTALINTENTPPQVDTPPQVERRAIAPCRPTSSKSWQRLWRATCSRRRRLLRGSGK